jgi:hypothetical protein
MQLTRYRLGPLRSCNICAFAAIYLCAIVLVAIVFLLVA